ncbi:cyclase family protein [Rhodococcus sp. 06-221-2]|uniref:cyclase family protein n=1 Tax=Rhodococcus sp. 06-221-2 TaxID=2022514 RepID=UPI0015C61C67|nr:cyclase family protein [Rhodococcus sp. 06-221-2]
MRAWTDLSHPLDPRAPRIAIFPAPSFATVAEMPADPMTVSQMDMVVHTGTHVDAPCHFVAGAESIDEIDLSRLTGEGVVCRVEAGEDEVYGLDALVDRELVREGDIVVLETGWWCHVGTPLYARHPSLSVDLARWLVDRRVSMIAVDTGTPDVPVQLRPEGFNWPVHQILLGAGVLIAEHVTNLTALSGQRVELMFAPLNIRGSDGAPVRAVGRPVS